MAPVAAADSWLGDAMAGSVCADASGATMAKSGPGPGGTAHSTAIASTTAATCTKG